MAGGGMNYPEDSGYKSVRGSREMKADYNKKSKESTELNGIKAMNKKLIKKVDTLEQEIYDKTVEFNDERMTMVRNHKRETDTLKMRHEKSLDRLTYKSRENERQEEEIKILKATINSLEKTINELKDKLVKARRRDDKHGNEYEQQRRMLLASEEKVEILKQRIDTLEDKIEKEGEKANEKYDKLSSEFRNLSRMQEHMSDKMDHMSNKMEEMFQQLLRNKDQNQVSENKPSFDENEKKKEEIKKMNELSKFPPINERHPSNDRSKSCTSHKTAGPKQKIWKVSPIVKK